MAEWQTQPTQNRLRAVHMLELGVKVPLALQFSAVVRDVEFYGMARYGGFGCDRIWTGVAVRRPLGHG